MINAKDLTAADVTFLAEIEADKMIGRLRLSAPALDVPTLALIHNLLGMIWVEGFSAGASAFARGLEQISREQAAKRLPCGHSNPEQCDVRCAR